MKGDAFFWMLEKGGASFRVLKEEGSAFGGLSGLEVGRPLKSFFMGGERFSWRRYFLCGI